MSVKSTSTIVILSLTFFCLMVFQRGFGRLQGRKLYKLAMLEEKLREGYVPVAIPETPVLVRGILYSETKASAVLGDKRKEEKLREGCVPVAVPETPVLVRGILYSETKASAILGDKRRIVYEEDTIQGVTIVKIHKDKVEFVKNGQRWTQRVGQTPKAHW